jgi:hypothetical protein
MPMPSPPEDERWIFNHDGGIQEIETETESESPSSDIVEARDF